MRNKLTRSFQEQEGLGENRTGEERGGQGLLQSLGSEELPGGHDLRDQKDTPGNGRRGGPESGSSLCSLGTLCLLGSRHSCAARIREARAIARESRVLATSAASFPPP